MHFLIKWLTGIIAITNSKGDSASPWKIPLWIITLVKPSPLAVSPFFHGIFNELYKFPRYLVNFKIVYYPALRDLLMCLFIVNPRHNWIFPSRFVSREDVLISFHRYLWYRCDILSITCRIVHGLLANRKSPSKFLPLLFCTLSVGTFWVCTCWRRLLFGESFWIMVVLCHLMSSIYSFL